MTKDEILTLVNAGYSKSEIDALEPAPEPVPAPEPEPAPAPEPEPVPEPEDPFRKQQPVGKTIGELLTGFFQYDKPEKK